MFADHPDDAEQFCCSHNEVTFAERRYFPGEKVSSSIYTGGEELFSNKDVNRVCGRIWFATNRTETEPLRPQARLRPRRRLRCRTPTVPSIPTQKKAGKGPLPRPRPPCHQCDRLHLSARGPHAALKKAKRSTGTISSLAENWSGLRTRNCAFRPIMRSDVNRGGHSFK